MARTTSTVLIALLLSSTALFALAPSATAAPFYYDTTIVSFDGTKIAATVFVPPGASGANRVPYVLMTHGWAGQRVDEPVGRVADLLDAGYGVLTWDSRGFGASGGDVELNSPDFEVKDVQVILDYLARAVPSAQRDAPGDPRVGMSGGSYAGGIQLLAAAFDSRIDVIAPEVTWYDLAQSLAPNGVPKLYWTSLLFAGGAEASCANARNGNPTGALAAGAAPLPWATGGCQTSDLARYYAEVHGTNAVSDEVRDALLYRSPSTYMSSIDVPTLLVQGFPDTLFDADQAVANYQGIKANGAPVKLWLYDGGHAHPEGPALANTQGAAISGVVINWFDRHLKANPLVDTGAEVHALVGDAWVTSTAWPMPELLDATRSINGLPSLIQGPVAGGNQATVNWPLAAGAASIVGSATASFDIAGLGSEGIFFVSLGKMNGTTVTRLGDQTQPVRTPISGSTLTHVEVDLVDVSGVLVDGETLVITFSSFDRNYNGNRQPGYVNIENLEVAWQTL